MMGRGGPGSPAGRLVSATSFTSATESSTATYTDNDAGELLQERIERGQGLAPSRRRLTYTKAGLPSTITLVVPGGDLVTTNTYTPAGWLRTTTDPRGCTVTRTYDDLGREVSTDGGACGGRRSFSYLPDGSLEQARDEGSGATTSMAYDAAGRLLRVCPTPAPCAAAQAETTYAYDAAGRLSSVTTPAGTTSYAYYDAGDALGLLKEVDDPFLASGKTTYAYDPAGRVTGRTDAQAGISWSQAYEPETGRLAERVATGPGGAPLARFAPTDDEAGHVRTRTVRIGAAGSDPRNGTWSYDDDEAGRLTRAIGPDPADPAEDTAFSWNGAGMLTAVDAPGSSADRSFRYDGLGRLSSATVGASSVSYADDGLARLTTRTHGGTTETLTSEGVGQGPARRVRGGTTTRSASTPAGPLAERTGTSVLFSLLDPHGDTVGTVAPGATVSLSDPSGLRPVCGEGCTPEEEAELVRAWAGAQTQAAASGTGAYDPGRIASAATPP